MVELFKVIGSFGIRGGIRIFSYVDDLVSYEIAYNKNGQACRFFVSNGDPSKQIIFIDGITDRNAADSLKGETFYIDRADLKELSEDQFYVCDIIGKEIHLENEDSVSCEVVSFQNYGAGDLVELAYSEETFLIPFTKENFPGSGVKIISQEAFRNFIKNVAG